MPDTEQVTQPSLGSNEPGTETHDVRIPSSVTAGWTLKHILLPKAASTPPMKTK